MPCFFNPLLSVWISDETLFFVFDILVTRHLSLMKCIFAIAHKVLPTFKSGKLAAIYPWDFKLIKGDKLHSDFLDSQNHPRVRFPNSFSWSCQTLYCYLCLFLFLFSLREQPRSTQFTLVSGHYLKTKWSFSNVNSNITHACVIAMLLGSNLELSNWFLVLPSPIDLFHYGNQI